MFKTTSPYGTINIFTNTENYLNERTKKRYTNETEWFNQFREQVTNRINENIFRPLYCGNNGAPNVPIRHLTAMLFLKCTRNYSVFDLFEQCEGNIFIRRALGLYNMDDIIPSRATFFNFINKLYKWEEEHGEDLLKTLFEDITRQQVIEFEVSGDKCRMDSTSLSSNIAWLNRYGVIHETLRLAYISAKGDIDKILCRRNRIILNEITEENCFNVSYYNTNSQLESKLFRLGSIIYKIITNIGDKTTKSVEMLQTVFYQHYEIKEDNIVLLPKQKLKASNIQSPHDDESGFISKNGKKVKGFNVNVTETCNPDNYVNFITDVSISSATVHDSNHLIPAIEATEKVTCQKVETINADGAYHSITNQEECTKKNIDFILSNLGGQASQYDLQVVENNNLIVTNVLTGEIIPATLVTRRNKNSPPVWKIINEKGTIRKFTHHDVDNNNLRKQINSRSKEEINLRNNVEATIHQMMYYYPNDKSKYRGKFKHEIWGIGRAICINCRRITIFKQKMLALFKNEIFLLMLIMKMRDIIKILFKIFFVIVNLMKSIKKYLLVKQYNRFSGQIFRKKWVRLCYAKTDFLDCRH